MEVIFLLSVGATALHALDEVHGEGGPLWDAVGRFAGTAIPRRVGIAAVAIALPFILSLLAGGAYLNGDERSMSMLAGARLGDAAFTHSLLWLLGVRPNPGISTSPMYVVEGVLLLLWAPVLPLDFAVAFLAFALPVPLLRLLTVEGC